MPECTQREMKQLIGNDIVTIHRYLRNIYARENAIPSIQILASTKRSNM